jgi:glycosyltransferase involved in cell wall biosynthesis
MPEPVRVSAVTPIFNRVRYLPECLDSVLAQDFPGVEHVLVDDGSTDETPEVLARYRAARGDRVRPFRQENRGQSEAWNRCVEEARGEYVAFLDSDDAWLPGKLRREIPLLDADPGAGLLYAALEQVDAEGRPSPVRPSRRATPSGWILPHLLRHNVMNTGTVIVRRALLREAGRFDPACRYSNDWDMWLRVCLRVRVLYDPVPSCRVRRHADQLTADRERIAEGWVKLLEDNLRRMETLAPEHLPLARRALASHHLRRARRALREGRRADMEASIARARELDSVGLRVLGLRFAALLRGGQSSAPRPPGGILGPR